jgi:hypothetical protein
MTAPTGMKRIYPPEMLKFSKDVSHARSDTNCITIFSLLAIREISLCHKK